MNGDEIRDKVVYSVVGVTIILVVSRIAGFHDWPWYVTFGPALLLVALAVFGSALALAWILLGLLLRPRR